LRMVVTRQAVSAWERGANAPNIVELMSLIALYGVSADQVLYGVDSSQVRGMLSTIFNKPAARASTEESQPS
jgi:transcriptional regulator with XRE-family HTH domain